MPVLVVQALRGELDASGLSRAIDGNASPIPPPSVAAGQTPLAYPSAALELYEEDLVAVIQNEAEACSAHLAPWVVHPATPRILVCPPANRPPVRAKGQIVVMGEHVILEPLGVQTFLPLDPQASADAFPTPYFEVMALALIVQQVGAHLDARLLACLPDGGLPQALPLSLFPPGRLHLPFLLP